MANSLFFHLVHLRPLTFTWKTSSLPPTLNWDSNKMVNFSSVTDSAPRRSDRLILFKDYMKDNMLRMRNTGYAIHVAYAVRLIMHSSYIYCGACMHNSLWVKVLGCHVNNLWRALGIAANNTCDVEASLRLENDPPWYWWVAMGLCGTYNNTYTVHSH